MLDKLADSLARAAHGLSLAFAEALVPQSKFEEAVKSASAPPPPSALSLARTQDWFVTFEKRGRKGQTLDVEITPQCFFRGEKIIAFDDSATIGGGSGIVGIRIGTKEQSAPLPPDADGTPTVTFSQNSLGTGYVLDTCQPAVALTVRVKFIEDCTFYATIFGKAII